MRHNDNGWKVNITFSSGNAAYSSVQNNTFAFRLISDLQLRSVPVTVGRIPKDVGVISLIITGVQTPSPPLPSYGTCADVRQRVPFNRIRHRQTN